MKSEVRRITDGAVMTALIGLLIILDGRSGVLLEGFLFWILPIPILVYTVKYNVSSGIMVSVSITLLALILTYPHLALLIGFSNMIGLAYAYGVNKKWEINRILLLTFIISFIYYVVSMILLASFFGYDAVAEIETLIASLTNMFSGTVNFIESKLGIKVEMIEFLKWTNPFFKMLLTFSFFLPSIIALLQTLITHMISMILLSRLKLAELKSKPFFALRISRKLGFIALILLILTYVYEFSITSSLDNVIILVQFVIQSIFIVMGAILALTYVSLKKKPLLSLIIGLLIIGAPLLIMVLGFVDVFSDLRMDLIRRAINEGQN